MQLILIVEDDRDTNLAIQDVLESEGFSCVPALDGEDGFRRLVEDHPALVLLDLDLPGLTGEEFLRRKARLAEAADIPVVVITGVSNVPKLDRIVEILRKPFSLEALLTLAKRYLPDPRLP